MTFWGIYTPLCVSSDIIIIIIIMTQPHFVSGYTGIATSESDGATTTTTIEQSPTTTPDDAQQEMSENDRKVIQSLKDWDLWYVISIK